MVADGGGAVAMAPARWTQPKMLLRTGSYTTSGRGKFGSVDKCAELILESGNKVEDCSWWRLCVIIFRQVKGRAGASKQRWVCWSGEEGFVLSSASQSLQGIGETTLGSLFEYVVL
jgi:hypothetical protein